LPRFFFFRFPFPTVEAKPLDGAAAENDDTGVAGVDDGAAAARGAGDATNPKPEAAAGFGFAAGAGRGDGRAVGRKFVPAALDSDVADAPAALPPPPPPMKEKPVEAGAAAALGAAADFIAAAAAAPPCAGGAACGFGLFGLGFGFGAATFRTRPAGGRAFGAAAFLPPKSHDISTLRGAAIASSLASRLLS
jgi:hypothetical protein